MQLALVKEDAEKALFLAQKLLHLQVVSASRLKAIIAWCYGRLGYGELSREAFRVFIKACNQDQTTETTNNRYNQVCLAISLLNEDSVSAYNEGILKIKSLYDCAASVYDSLDYLMPYLHFHLATYLLCSKGEIAKAHALMSRIDSQSLLTGQVRAEHGILRARIAFLRGSWSLAHKEYTSASSYYKNAKAVAQQRGSNKTALVPKFLDLELARLQASRGTFVDFSCFFYSLVVGQWEDSLEALLAQPDLDERALLLRHLLQVLLKRPQLQGHNGERSGGSLLEFSRCIAFISFSGFSDETMFTKCLEKLLSHLQNNIDAQEKAGLVKEALEWNLDAIQGRHNPEGHTSLESQFNNALAAIRSRGDLESMQQLLKGGHADFIEGNLPQFNHLKKLKNHLSNFCRSSFAGHLAVAMQFLQTGHWTEAVEQAKEALSLASVLPTHHKESREEAPSSTLSVSLQRTAWLVMGAGYFGSRAWMPARKAFERVLNTLDRHDQWALCALATTYLELSRVDRKRVQRHPKYWQTFCISFASLNFLFFLFVMCL